MLRPVAQRKQQAELAGAAAIDQLVNLRFPTAVPGDRIEIIDGEYVAMPEVAELAGIAFEQLPRIVKLQANRVVAGEVRTRVEQMGFTAVGATPDSELRLALPQNQGLQAGDDQPRLIGYEIVKAELSIQGER